MKKAIKSIALSALITSSTLGFAHSPLDEMPDLSNFSKQVQDWEKHQSFYAEQELDILDVHLHPGTFDKLGPKGKEFVKSVFPVNLPDFIKVPLLRFFSSFQLNPYGAFIGIKNECRRASANNCILFATYAPETWGIEPNEDVIGYLDDKRNEFNGSTYFYGLASLNVADWENNKAEQLKNLETALQHPKMVGVKLAFAHTLTPFDDPQYFDIYDIAEQYNKPIYHHVGTSPLRKVSEFEESDYEFLFRTFVPSYLEPAIKQYPKVNFIMGHAGNDANKEGYSKIDEVIEIASRFPNVYVEVSALASDRSDPDGSKLDGIFIKAKQLNIVDRLIYGSDGPGSPGNIGKYKERVLESLERVGYSFSEAQAVMADNARALFNIPKPATDSQ
ncbi:MAG: amidohydrolase family protein [Gammaproteobacteria bacterium]|nr:amidohydrolase family protein [Gammaproteobacteria bacterium]